MFIYKDKEKQYKSKQSLRPQKSALPLSLHKEVRGESDTFDRVKGAFISGGMPEVSNARLYTDDAAVKAQGSYAYTQGENIYVGSAFAKNEGIISHELGHVFQQKQGRVFAERPYTNDNADPALEAEATAMLSAGRPQSSRYVSSAPSSRVIQRADPTTYLMEPDAFKNRTTLRKPAIPVEIDGAPGGGGPSAAGASGSVASGVIAETDDTRGDMQELDTALRVYHECPWNVLLQKTELFLDLEKKVLGYSGPQQDNLSDFKQQMTQEKTQLVQLIKDMVDDRFRADKLDITPELDSFQEKKAAAEKFRTWLDTFAADIQALPGFADYFREKKNLAAEVILNAEKRFVTVFEADCGTLDGLIPTVMEEPKAVLLIQELERLKIKYAHVPDMNLRAAKSKKWQDYTDKLNDCFTRTIMNLTTTLIGLTNYDKTILADILNEAKQLGDQYGRLNIANFTGYTHAPDKTADLASLVAAIAKRTRELLDKAFFDTVPPSTVAVDEMKKDYGHVADGIISAIYEAGVRMRYTASFAADTLGDSFGLQMPRGHSKSWKDEETPGVFAPETTVNASKSDSTAKLGATTSTKGIVLAQIGMDDATTADKKHSSYNMQLHELGHGIDYTLLSQSANVTAMNTLFKTVFALDSKITDSTHFNAIFGAERAVLFPDVIYGNDYFKNIEEYFAEAFAMFHSRRALDYNTIAIKYCCLKDSALGSRYDMTLYNKALEGHLPEETLKTGAPKTYNFFEELQKINS